MLRRSGVRSIAAAKRATELGLQAFNILEGLKQAADSGALDQERFKQAEARALGFMLAHQMYRSDKTGKVISDRFTVLTFPSHWHYTVLRGLDYMRASGIHDRAQPDPRLGEAFALLRGRRLLDERWPLDRRHPGRQWFEVDDPEGKPSRWVTLLALRVLRWAQR